MDVKITKASNKDFVPCTVELTMNSITDAIALFHIFNHSDNTQLFRDYGSCAETVRSALDSQYPKEDLHKSIEKCGVTYAEFYK